MKRQCRKIWQRVFGNSEEFMNLYFSRRYADDCTFTARIEENVVSCAQCFVYDMNGEAGETPFRTGYVSGLATLPEFRGKGFAQQVMQQLHQWLRNQEIECCILIPSGPDAARWYRRHFGYRDGVKIQKFLIPQTALQSFEIHSTPFDEATKFIMRELSIRPNYLHHTAEDLADQWNVCAMSGGGVAVHRNRNGNIAECAFVEYHDEQPVMLDYFFDSNSGEAPKINLCDLKHPDCPQGMWLPLSANFCMKPAATISLMLD